ncbi:hypothetical protein FHP08_05810 [Zeimonas arvi]|uniref:Uncharacterized protein n=1 Tax=Zeimonas arvi TaxID=2498847 RepID=A0A5C8P198_9BURK|nr:hypothetical protein FHP08_05810 [Zeimonas arvi]
MKAAPRSGWACSFFDSPTLRRGSAAAAIDCAKTVWLWLVDGIPLTRWDVVGAGIALAGMAVIALQPNGQ